MNNEEVKESQIQNRNDTTTDEMPVAICIETESIPYEILRQPYINAINIESYSYYDYNHPPELSNSQNHIIINIDPPFPRALTRTAPLPTHIPQESSNTKCYSFLNIRQIICTVIAFAAIMSFIFTFHPSR
jgi:hypothetical protein